MAYLGPWTASLQQQWDIQKDWGVKEEEEDQRKHNVNLKIHNGNAKPVHNTVMHRNAGVQTQIQIYTYTVL